MNVRPVFAVHFSPKFCIGDSVFYPYNTWHLMKRTFDSIESVVADLRKGKMVIVVDDADRENEGDLIMAAQHATPQAINFMAKHGRGLICVPTTSERLKQLGIEPYAVELTRSVETSGGWGAEESEALPDRV